MSETPARCLLRSCDRSEAQVAFADATAARQSAPPWGTCYREWPWRRASRPTTCWSVYGWFTEGFDTLDLKEAKALLNELNA
jgi:hypothetical protein